MKVAFDHQIFVMQKYGGISRYFCRLAQQLRRMPEVLPEIFAPLHFNQHLAEIGGDLHRGLQVPFEQAVFHRNLARSRGMGRYAGANMARHAMSFFQPDICHETYYSEESICPTGRPHVLTTYDMIHERYPALFHDSKEVTRAKRAAFARADHVFCISENTRKDLMTFFDVPEEKTSVTYLGVEEIFFSPAVEDSSVWGRPYLLYVGNRDGYKNFDGFLRAFSSSAQLLRQYDVLCFGGGLLQQHELDLIADLGLGKDQVAQINGEDDMLVRLYQQAQALVYPSLYEGFGLPPLEAMAARCPVICSNTSSLPEVVGEAAELFDPLDEHDMQVAMERVLDSPPRRQALIELGRVQCGKFSWKKCAEETTAVYRRLLGIEPESF